MAALWRLGSAPQPWTGASDLLRAKCLGRGNPVPWREQGSHQVIKTAERTSELLALAQFFG